MNGRLTKLLSLSFGVLLILLLGTGCQTYSHQARGITANWVGGRPTVAAREFGHKAAHCAAKDAVIWNLEAGAAYRAAGQYHESNAHFDTAEQRIRRYEQQAKVKVGHETLALFSNQQNLPYEGRPYDKIMLHTYMALNYLDLGEPSKARPELIGAYQAQQDAVQDNARRIERAREAEAQSEHSAAIERTRNDPRLASALDPITRDFDDFRVYAGYVNPFTVYLDGLFFLYRGTDGSELERSLKSLRRVLAVAGANRFVQEDVQTAERAVNGQPPSPCTYVIFETGRAASREQVRIDIPILFINLSYVGAAFPKLAFHDDYVRELWVHAGQTEVATQPVCNMDSVIVLDFKNEWPTILTKTLISTVAKAAATYAINEAVNRQDQVAGIFSKLLTAAAQAAMNIADTRSWTTLPKEFEVARISTPPDRRLTLSAPDSPPVQVVLEPGKVNVVYVKSIATGTPLLVSQFKLQ